MKRTVGFNDFVDDFNSCRPDNFSYAGLRALYDYLGDYEDSCGEEIELTKVKPTKSIS